MKLYMTAIIYGIAPNFIIMWLTFIFHIQEVPPSNLIPRKTYPDSEFIGFPWSLKANATTVPNIRLHLFLSICFQLKFTTLPIT